MWVRLVSVLVKGIKLNTKLKNISNQRLWLELVNKFNQPLPECGLGRSGAPPQYKITNKNTKYIQYFVRVATYRNLRYDHMSVNVPYDNYKVTSLLDMH